MMTSEYDSEATSNFSYNYDLSDYDLLTDTIEQLYDNDITDFPICCESSSLIALQDISAIQLNIEAEIETETDVKNNISLTEVECAVNNILEQQDDNVENTVDTNAIYAVDDVVQVGNEISFDYKCKYCCALKKTRNKQFLTHVELMQHIKTIHDVEHPYNCPYCEQKFQDAALRTVHMKEHHVEKRYACNSCEKKYADRGNLRHHIEKIHSDATLNCPECRKTFATRKSLSYHMKWHNPVLQVKCRYCDKKFITVQHLKIHEGTHTEYQSNLHCVICEKPFKHVKTLRWHIFKQHDGDKPYKCRCCTDAFISYREKRLHMLKHHANSLTEKEKSECMICHKKYTNHDDLRMHMDMEHIQSCQTPIVLDNNKRVVQKKAKKQYSGLFECDICHQRYNMKSALERHAAVHSIEGRPHACPNCSKRFKRIQDMQWHLKTHSKEKTNICDICGKGFALKYVLTQHKRIHEVLERNFTCTTCGRSYLYEKSLKLHERIHTGQTYYKCDLCDESFVTHVKFKYHIRKMHISKDTPNIELPSDEQSKNCDL